MISLRAFLTGVQENVSRIHSYQLGHDGSDGTCDCIGLIIGAIELAGGDWPWTHGSNYAARNCINNLHYVSSASQLSRGDIVFKAKEPGDDGYDLPSRYDSSPDRRDYYHVGVVTSASPFRITHCTGVDGGIKVDTSLGRWHYAGELNLVDYSNNEGEGNGDGSMNDEVLYRARVLADNDYPVKMRKLPSTQSSVIMQVPLGSIVEVRSEVDDTWAAINYMGKDGYMMRKFLHRGEETDNGGEYVAITLRRDIYEALKEGVINATGI